MFFAKEENRKEEDRHRPSRGTIKSQIKAPKIKWLSGGDAKLARKIPFNRYINPSDINDLIKITNSKELTE